MQNKKGFTLLELIVAMAIIAVLMGLSLFGIQAVQRSQRDTERRAALSNINLEIAAYYGDNGSYPTLSLTTAGAVTIGGKASTIKLSGAATPKVLTNGATACDVSAATYQNGSCYCYSASGGTYKLGIYLEGTGWGTAGTAQQLGNNGACSL